MKAVALVLTLAGCSFVMTDRPKPPPQDPGCTTSYSSVVLDIVGALTWPFLLGGVYVATQANDGNLDDGDGATVGLLVAGTFIAEVVSAGVGISRVGDCKDAYETRRRYPYPYPYYPQPYPQQPQPYPPPYVPPQPQPQPPPPTPPQPRGLGIEGDACNFTNECAAGLSCTAGRCARR